MVGTITMDNAVKLGVHFLTILEKLKKLGDVNNEQLTSNSNVEKYVQDEICALLDAEAPISEYFIKYFEVFNRTFVHFDPTLQLSGSTVEGAMMARCFQIADKWKEIEVDCMSS